MIIINQYEILIIFILGLNLSRASSWQSDKTSPHIIFILADDLGWNDVGFHGNDVISTPNIDALAYSGVILNNYYVQPICTPSRGALLSGMYPTHIGLQHSAIGGSTPFGLPLNFTLFPQYLKELGYSTRIVGKWHLGHFRKEYTPTFRGFDSHYGYWNGAIGYFNYTFAFDPNGFSGHDFRRNMETDYPKTGAYATDLFTEETIRIINDHNASKPLFLYLSHLAAHTGGNPSALLEAPEDAIQRFTHINDEGRRTYAAMLWKLDESVGKVVEALQENNMLNDSIIVFSTDNGGESAGCGGCVSSNWPLRGLKETLWEGGIRGSAFVWSSLLNNPGRVSMEMMHITDWLPTLYHAIGGADSVLPKMDGMNVWNSIQGNSPSPRNEFLVNIDPIFNGASIRLGQWKLLHNPFDTSEFGPEFNCWTGSKERDFRKNNSLTMENYLNDVKNSFAGLSVQKLMPDILENILRIREDSEFTCDEVPENATVTCFDASNPCLFNIVADPCEYFDVSNSYPAVVDLLQKRLQIYNSTAVPKENKPNDPRANPKFWNNTWTNWFDFLEENSDIYEY